MNAGRRRSRVIFHVDMNSFYASVETAHHPELKGRPLAIAGRAEERRGIVVTSSYEARRMGVKTTMTVQEARRKCPELIIKHPDFPLYRRVSGQLFHLLKRYTPIVEKASIDEGYMDVTSLLPPAPPLELAKNIQFRVGSELGLPCSIGIAPNKFLAKTASDMKKPMGITVLRKREIRDKLWPLPIGAMHGVGPKTEEKLMNIGIQTIGDLAKSDRAFIAERFGLPGKRLHERANGQDDRAVDPEAEDRYKTIGHSTTLPEDTASFAVIRRTLDKLAGQLADKIKREQVASYQLTIMIRYHDWKTVTRNLTVNQPIDSKKQILENALALFHAQWNGAQVRLLGITLGSFKPLGESTKQLDIFSYEEDAKHEPIAQLISAIDEKFGEGTIRPASLLKRAKKKTADHNAQHGKSGPA